MKRRIKKNRICVVAMALAMTMAGMGCGSGQSKDNKEEITTTADNKESTDYETAEQTTEQNTEEINNRKEAPIDVTAEDPYEGELPAYEVTYKEGNYGKCGIIEFDWEGHSYEMCLAGLPRELADDKIKTIIGGFISGSIVKVTGDGILDAEKQSSKVSWNEYDCVSKEYGRDEMDWGDSLMCWAATDSNMLVLSGWNMVAAEESEAREFTNEDVIYNYFDTTFTNNGYQVYDGLAWFFGGDHDDMEIGETDSGGILKKYNYKDYIKTFSFSKENAEKHNDLSDIACAVEIVSGLKEGNAVGIDIMIDKYSFSTKKKISSAARYLSERGGFVTLASIDVPDDDPNLVEAYYSFNTDGTIVKLDMTDEGYVTEDGKRVDEINVYTGMLYRLESGEYIKAVQENSRYTAVYYVNCDEADVDMKNPSRCLTIEGSGHALTVSGYVIDKSESKDENKIKALFITDSDNDAGYYILNDENIDRTKRTNSMTLYMTELVKSEEGTKTLNIVNYMKYADSPVKRFTVLKSRD